MSIWQLLICSYATGWVMIALQAKQKGMVDLCQFVRWFALSPFIFILIALISTRFGYWLWTVIIPNIMKILYGIILAAGAVSIFFGLGYFAVMPAVKKAYGIAKPFSDKICIVLYKKK